ncbi:hypothetical protein BaRGS_00038863, partial [Batillaria attramentaria]
MWRNKRQALSHLLPRLCIRSKGAYIGTVELQDCVRIVEILASVFREPACQSAPPLLGDGWAESALERSARVGRATYLRAAGRKPAFGSQWAESTLEHSSRVVHDTYVKAAQRRVDWPVLKESTRIQRHHTSLEGAYRSTMDSLAMISRQCRVSMSVLVNLYNPKWIP